LNNRITAAAGTVKTLFEELDSDGDKTLSLFEFSELK